MAEHPLVSVVVPFHDRPDLLRACVASVVAQTHRPIQLVLVDDASERPIDLRDDLGLAHDHGLDVELVRSDANVGPGAARELGRRRVRGQFVCYLDSDDAWLPEKLSRQLEVLTSAGAGMCYTATGYFVDDPFSDDIVIRPGSDVAHASIVAALLGRRPWSTSSVMWTREAADLVGPWLGEWSWEDYAYDCKAGCLGITAASVAEPLTRMRRSDDGGHLSQEGGAVAVGSRARCVREMHRYLVASGTIGEEGVWCRFSQLVLRSAFDCRRAGVDAEVGAMFALLTRPPATGPTTVLARVLDLAARLLPPASFERLRYRSLALLRAAECR